MIPFGRHRPQRNWGARASLLAQDGLDLVVLENERLRLAFLAGKGADLVEWLWKPLDLDLAWLTPNGIGNPADLPASAPHPVASFIDSYPGGWQTVFPNGGAPSEVDGAPYGQHGEACLLPWDAWLAEDGERAVEAVFAVRLRRAPFVLERRVRLEAGAAEFSFVERAKNLAPVPARAMWGQHVCFGPPFLDDSCRIALPDGITVTPHPTPLFPEHRTAARDPFPWPHAPAHGGGTVDLRLAPPAGSPSEMLYLTGFPDDAWYAIDNPGRDIRATVRWDAAAQPTLWFWQESGATAGWPWFGRARVIGLEPFAGWPTDGFAAAAATGSVLTFAPGETKTIRIRASVGPVPEEAAR